MFIKINSKNNHFCFVCIEEISSFHTGRLTLIKEDNKIKEAIFIELKNKQQLKIDYESKEERDKEYERINQLLWHENLVISE